MIRHNMRQSWRISLQNVRVLYTLSIHTHMFNIFLTSFPTRVLKLGQPWPDKMRVTTGTNHKFFYLFVGNDFFQKLGYISLKGALNYCEVRNYYLPYTNNFLLTFQHKIFLCCTEKIIFFNNRQINIYHNTQRGKYKFEKNVQILFKYLCR